MFVDVYVCLCVCARLFAYVCVISLCLIIYHDGRLAGQRKESDWVLEKDMCE